MRDCYYNLLLMIILISFTFPLFVIVVVTCKHNNPTTNDLQLNCNQFVQYIFLIVAILALDFATGLLAIIFQEKLVADVRLRLVGKLKSDYGVHASFTAAVDFVSNSRDN